MAIRIENHPECNGTGRIPNDNAGEQRKCSWCNGYGVLKANGGSYRSTSNAQIGINHKSARDCYSCDGKGYHVVPESNPCYGPCTDGKIVVEAHVGDVLPDEIDRTRSISKPVMAVLAAELDIRVGAENRGSTWNEAYLGLGTLWSTEDYGRMWDELAAAAVADRDAPKLTHDGLPHTPSNLAVAIDAFREEIRADLADDYVQWVKLIDSKTRTIVDRVGVVVHRGGYTVASLPSIESGNRVVLPPAYTPELLNKEV